MKVVAGTVCFLLAAVLLFIISPVVFGVALIAALLFGGFFLFSSMPVRRKGSADEQAREDRRALGYD